MRIGRGKTDGGFGFGIVILINPQRTAKAIMAQTYINYILLKTAPSGISFNFVNSV